MRYCLEEEQLGDEVSEIEFKIVNKTFAHIAQKHLPQTDKRV